MKKSSKKTTISGNKGAYTKRSSLLPLYCDGHFFVCLIPFLFNCLGYSICPNTRGVGSSYTLFLFCAFIRICCGSVGGCLHQHPTILFFLSVSWSGSKNERNPPPFFLFFHLCSLPPLAPPPSPSPLPSCAREQTIVVKICLERAHPQKSFFFLSFSLCI